MRDKYGKFWHNFRASVKGLYANRDRSRAVFRSKFTEEEAEELYKRATPEDLATPYLMRLKDKELQYLIDDISKKESQGSYSIMVLSMDVNDAHIHFVKRYYSMEEYLVGMYNRGDDFTLFVSGTNELYVVNSDGMFDAIYALRPEGDMLYRDIMHNYRFEKEEAKFRVICTEILSNRHLTVASNEITCFEKSKSRQLNQFRPRKNAE